jgi:predicted O-methyltransferase YrrM
MGFWHSQMLEPFFDKLQRRSDLLKIVKPNGIGAELGVAEGYFSSEILATEQLAHLYSIDMYAGDRGHDVKQYTKAIRGLAKFRDRNSIIKMRFDEALGVFDDSYFDFIYVDGYAHTGEEEGKTFSDWFPKLKPGGVIAGHDYSPKFPLVKRHVDAFLSKHDLKLNVVNDLSEGWNHGCPSWFSVKP